MIERTARAAADNNVQDVISAIDNYTCGSIRALAQDPPQNSLDARRDGQKVFVAYQVVSRQLGKGNAIQLMTITDRGTTGLDGAILTAEDLAQREKQQGQLVIQSGENWAAWEAMRYTKSGQDSLGSRGQGKYAYLYHSLHPAPGASPNFPKHAGRVIILYDTLLHNGEYRLGVRYHNPSSKVIEPPFTGDEAMEIVKTKYENEHFTIPLQLEPLSEPGTRIIIPFLSKEAADAVQSDELAYWLQAEWWRPIQKNELEITVASEDGLTRSIEVPDFWQAQPWTTNHLDYQVQEQVALLSSNNDDPRRIKRCVLFHNSDLTNQDKDGPAQLNGVQLFRGGQWIVTLEMKEFSDWIPKEHREGFRGFVEFDRVLERDLREVENPAHDGYNRRTALYRAIVSEICNQVKEFADKKGWHDAEDSPPDPQFDSLVQEFARLFVSPEPGSQTPTSATWHCNVDAAYPDPAIAAVSWGQVINVAVTCRRRPAADGESIEFNAELVRPDGSSEVIFAPRHQNMRQGVTDESSAGVDFGELVVDHPKRPESPFTEPGRYSIEVQCTSQGQVVATGRCSFYVACNPPKPALNPVTIQLQAFNREDSSNIIPQGEVLQWQATVRNRGQAPVDGTIAVVLGEHRLTNEAVSLDKVAVGDHPQSQIFEGSARVLQSAQPSGTLPFAWDSSTHEHTEGKEQLSEMPVLPLSNGRHTVVASFEHDGKPLAAARASIWVGTPPEDDESGDMPFRVAQTDKPMEPRWRLEQPRSRSDDLCTLYWSAANPIFQAIRSSRQPRSKSQQAPQEEYLAEIIAEALVDWSVSELQQSGDEGSLRLVSNRILHLNPELGERFEDLIELVGSAAAASDPLQYGETQRKMAALMVEAVRQKR